MSKSNQLGSFKVKATIGILAIVGGVILFLYIKASQMPVVQVILTSEPSGTLDSIAGLKIYRVMKEELAQANLHEGSHFAASFTHAPDSRENAIFLAKQAYQQPSSIVVALGDLAAEATIAENKNPENLIIYYSTKDHSRAGAVGFLNCGPVDHQKLGHEIGKILAQTLGGQKPVVAQAQCIK